VSAPDKFTPAVDRLRDVLEDIASVVRRCDPTLHFEFAHYETPHFPLRVYANYSGSAEREDMVLSFNCWRAPDGHLELSADTAREGATVLADWGPVVLTVPVGSTEAAVAWPYVAAVEEFFSGCVGLLRAELCPDEEFEDG
jgi:hypothetical protein